MPQAATLPRPAQVAPRRDRATVRHVPIEERVSVLETHAQSIATKADISELRSELIKWGVGGGIALFAAFAAMFIGNTARIDRLDGKIDASVSKLEAKLEQSTAKLDARIEKLDGRINRLEERVEARFDKLDAKFDALLDELRALRRGASAE